MTFDSDKLKTTYSSRTTICRLIPMIKKVLEIQLLLQFDCVHKQENCTPMKDIDSSLYERETVVTRNEHNF